MPSPAIVNVLALGFVGLVTAGLYLFATYYSPEEEHTHPRSSHPRSRSPPKRKPPPSEGWGNAKDQTCFCNNNEEYGRENCYLRVCTHRFHRRCISQWSEESVNLTNSRKPVCPYCRLEFDVRLDLVFD